MNRACGPLPAAAAAALLAGCAALPRPTLDQLSVAQRRAQLQQEALEGPSAIPDLAAALDDPHPLVRRQAARLLLEMGPPARDALRPALESPDTLVRRTALKLVWTLPTEEALPILDKGIGDPSPLVRQAAVDRLGGLRPQTDAVKSLLRRASQDEADSVRLPALKALWPFHRESVPLRERHYDHAIEVAATVRLPKEGWRFQLDPQRQGHTLGWFQPAFDDASWRPIAIEQAWQKAGVDYVGVAWYRRWVELPPRPEGMVAAELHFQGVDECAWVWVNGVYVGQHDIGPQGWDQPFRLDATKELRWGERNQITVRAMNTFHAGGIWRPVLVEALR